jgi:adenosylhomocysteine nucleosidase
LQRQKPELVISAGFAGGLQPILEVGDAVADFQGLAPFSGMTPPAGLRIGKMETAKEAIETVEAKERLGKETGALAVEMETGIIVGVCREFSVPVIAVRSISDTVRDALPVPLEHWFDVKKQRPRVAGLLGYLITHPGKIAPFARFVGGLSKARKGLASALGEVIGAWTHVRSRAGN